LHLIKLNFYGHIILAHTWRQGLLQKMAMIKGTTDVPLLTNGFIETGPQS
jgi:hypothetical protein